MWTPDRPDFHELVKELLALKASNEELTKRVFELEQKMEMIHANGRGRL